MNVPLLALAAAALSSTALAQPRPSTLGMSCNEVRSVIAARGAAVLNTGPTTYSRFVSSVGACERGQVTIPAWARTADQSQCFVGYRCRDTDLDNGR
jgi:hypothetical protein